MRHLRLSLLVAYVFMTQSAHSQVLSDTVHTHDHDHNHDHMHMHQHMHDHAEPHSHDTPLGHSHDHEHVHDHGHPHTHDEFSISAIGARAVHNASFNSLPPVENCCSGFTTTTGMGFGLQVAMSTPISNDGWLLSPHLSYQAMPVSFESFTTEKAFTGGVVSGDALFRHTLDVSWTTFNLGAVVEYPVIDQFLLGLGLDAMFVASGSFHQTETLEQPTNLVFETGTRVRLDRSGYVRGYNDVVFNATASARSRIVEKSATSIGLDAFGRYSFPLSQLYAPQTWIGGSVTQPAQFYIDRYSVSMLTFGLGIVL